MKTKINIFKVILSVIAVITFFSCDNPTFLGARLDLNGPVVTITSPKQRQSVPEKFDMEGTVYDESLVDKMIITAVNNNQNFPRQWRYQNDAWQISDNYGASWKPYPDASWTGDKSVSWKLVIDMNIDGQIANEGEYTFNIQAWDKGGMSDDNSFKALVLIVDLDPPKVVITNPYLYSKYAYESDDYFIKLDAIPDESDDWQDPAYLGKFITQEFPLKWQIEDVNDVWSIDIRFYHHDADIDSDPGTPLPDTYIYRYFKNLPPPPSMISPDEEYVKLNGSVTVPDLYGSPGIYEGGGELKTPVPLKEAVKVVAVCYDAAGNANQEKILGYFISWPKANTPWIVFTEGIDKPDDYYDKQVAYDDKNPGNEYIEENDDVFTVYPGRSVKATAFQAHGVKEVKYTLYECSTAGNMLNRPDETKPVKIDGIEQKDIVVSNTAYGGTYSNIFPWEIKVPPFTGYYVFTAEAYSSQGKPSEKYTMLFRVHDITFPDFVEGPFPVATEPLFMAIENNTITISGKASDATDVVSLCMVWINPNSEGYSAMSQLSYFRNNSYAGWKDALTMTPGNSKLEQSGFAAGYPYDPKAPNRLWNLTLKPEGMDYETNRHIFSFSVPIEITNELGIGPGSDDKNLKSQIFLFRAQNPDGKCTIITYAPQGDTLAPVIEISEVIIKSGSAEPETFYPNTYNVVPQFEDGDTITINGTWWEDSVAYLDIEKYFLKNIEITVNNIILPELTLANITGANTQEGTWSIMITVGNEIAKDKLKDTLVIGVKARDIGGNEAETGCSWLIQSDNLRLMRISSETEDGIYKAGDKVKIFLEFSKPVKLTYNTGVKPELILSSNTGIAARAVYMDGQDNYNSRQVFEYTVVAGHNTGSNYLNVKGLYCGSEYTTSTPYITATYPFTWSRGSAATSDYEEVRITMQANKKGDTKEGSASNQYYVRTLPTASNPDDYQFTLTAGKHIKIDTTAPTRTSVAPATIAGHYKSGDIYITVTFSKEIATGDIIPQLTLNVTGGGDPKTEAANIKVNGNTITFMYRIKTGDTTSGNQVQVTGFTGDIVDLAGNALSGGITGTLTGIYIDTVPLTVVPVIRVLSANNISNVIGASGAADVDLKNLYNADLWLAVEGMETAWHKLDKLEYSINGGTSWLTAGNITNAPFNKPDSMTQGSYTLIARQVNKAGNVSPDSNKVTLTWDPGNLITRISSTNANGTYTNTIGNGGDRQDTIYITLYFRKKIKLSTIAPTITVNSTSTPAPVDSYTVGNAVDELTFKYQVGPTDNTPSGQNLDVTSFNLSGSTATDEAGVIINNYLGLPSAGSLLKDLKQIKIQTGALSVYTAAVFNNSQVTGGGLASDGSYNTALVIGFNRNIYKGAGEITIIQSATDYRLPAVITESQFNKYSGIENVNKYYTRGSNGYLYNSTTDRKPDTTTKYILKYSVDTTASANAPSAPGDEIQELAEAFRQAERVRLSINANAVRISGDQLIVELTDTNALQVPGTTYQVYYPKGFVQDELNTPCPEVTVSSPTSVPLDGVAKPFIRVNKTQDSITVNSSHTATSPAYLVATQPFQANVRMDCRTPGSTIYYFTNDAVTTTNAMNWTYNASPASNGPNDLTTPAAPGQPSDPQTVTANRQTYNSNNPLTIGTANDYQGLQWYVRAKAYKGNNTALAANWSVNSEEMAFKTVITYVITGPMTNADNGIRPEQGDQIWIRGGDAVGSSSIPGFPITWDISEFDKVKEEGRRAGIRLFTNTTTTNNIYTNSTWKFITWEINVDTYFDIILGRDETSTAAEALQYGPKAFAYQRAGWTSYKEQFRALPGKHRWLVSNNPSGTDTKGTLNFSGTFSARPSYSGANITYPPAP